MATATRTTAVAPIPGVGTNGLLTGPGSTAAASTLTGTVQPGTGVYGSVPTVPDPTATQSASILGNLSNLGSLASLIGGADTIASQNALAPLTSALPGLSGDLSSEMTNISQELAGQVPQDVQNQIFNTAADRGIATGQGANSPNANAAMLQALGLTSQQEEQTGESNLTNLMGSIPTGQQVNVSSLLTTPSEEQAAQTAANVYAAAPNPTAAGEYEQYLLQNGLGGTSGTGTGTDTTGTGGLTNPGGVTASPGVSSLYPQTPTTSTTSSTLGGTGVAPATAATGGGGISDADLNALMSGDLGMGDLSSVMGDLGFTDQADLAALLGGNWTGSDAVGATMGAPSDPSDPYGLAALLGGTGGYGDTFGGDLGGGGDGGGGGGD